MTVGSCRLTGGGRAEIYGGGGGHSEKDNSKIIMVNSSRTLSFINFSSATSLLREENYRSLALTISPSNFVTRLMETLRK